MTPNDARDQALAASLARLHVRADRDGWKVVSDQHVIKSKHSEYAAHLAVDRMRGVRA